MTGIQLLGAVALHGEDGPLDLGHVRQRTVFAILAIHNGSVVSAPWLVEQIWGTPPPPRARDSLYSYISRLRKIISNMDGIGLLRDPNGYRLTVAAEDVDLQRFRALAARAASLPDTEAVPLWETALGLWNGEALADVTAPELTRLRESLTEERFAAELDHADALLRTGAHSRLAPLLRERSRRHPLDERLAGQLMLALHRDGNTGAALDHYAALASRLLAERGGDPGPALRRLRDEIRGTGTASATPRQLPGDLAGFVGRESTLSDLDSLHASTSAVVITGTAGVGKTTLAVHWAHWAAHRFPDGQLYLNLRGYDPSGTPMTAETAIRVLLDGLGVARQQIPAGFDAQAARYRELLDGRSVLIVLDNAGRPDQVEPLLPATGGSLAVVTSRRPLAGPAGFVTVALDVLDLAEARDLLARRVGAARAKAEPAVVDEIIELCARLPIALSVVAARAALRPADRLAAIAAEIRGHDTRLSAFDSGEDLTSPRAVFAWSYRALSPAAARLFQTLSLNPGPDFSTEATAALCGLASGRTRELLTELTETGLLNRHGLGRYAFHDLLRAYSRELGETRDTGESRATALRRLLGWTVHTAEAAAGLVNTSRSSDVTTAPPPGIPTLRFPDPDAAWRWFDAEHAGLVALVKLAHAEGLHREAIDLAWTANSYFNFRAHPHSAVTVHETAVEAARRVGDRKRQARSLRNLAGALRNLHRFDAARHRLYAALDLFDETEPGQLADIHISLGVLYYREDRYAESLTHNQRALELHRAAGHQLGIATTLGNIGGLHAQLGDPGAGLPYCEEALRMYGPDLPFNRAGVLDSLGTIHAELGDHAKAIACQRQAVALFRECGHTRLTADSLSRLGTIHEAADDLDAARAAHREALSILDEIGHPDAATVRARLRRLE